MTEISGGMVLGGKVTSVRAALCLQDLSADTCSGDRNPWSEEGGGRWLNAQTAQIGVDGEVSKAATHLSAVFTQSGTDIDLSASALP